MLGALWGPAGQAAGALRGADWLCELRCYWQ